MKDSSASRSKIKFGILGLISPALLIAATVGVYWGYRAWRRSALDHAIPSLAPAAITIVPGVHLLGGLEPSAAYVIESTDELILIDSGLDSEARLLKAQVAELGLDWRNIRAVFLTHAHGDHCGGAEHLRKTIGAKIYIGAGDADVVRQGKPKEAFFSVFHMPDVEPHPTTIDVELKGGEEIAFGDVTVRALATPGHTPGSTCYLVEKNGIRAFFAGDVVSMLLGYKGSTNIHQKALGTYSAYLAPRYRGDATTFLESLLMLRRLAVPDLVLPGHPRDDPIPQNPRMTKERWLALFDEGIEDLKTLLGHYEADGADFLDGNPKRITERFFYLGDRGGRASYAAQTGEGLIVVDAPGGPGYAEFLNERLAALGIKPAKPSSVLLTDSGEAEISGLDDLIKKTGAKVFAAREAIGAIQKLCPAAKDVAAAEDLSTLEGLTVRATRLHGRGIAPVAYRIDEDGKSILVSGRFPIVSNHESIDELQNDIAGVRDRAIDFIDSVDRLARPRPNVWLPAIAVDGQNANVYEDDWNENIRNSLTIGYSLLLKAH
jgi:glyoxylase-like metal-dependent hydrolase (beta-lactamase superfamily II)